MFAHRSLEQERLAGPESPDRVSGPLPDTGPERFRLSQKCSPEVDRKLWFLRPESPDYIQQKQLIRKRPYLEHPDSDFCELELVGITTMRYTTL